MPNDHEPRAIPDPHRIGCTSYHGGHNVHWIQALHTANKPEVARLTWSAAIVGIEGEVITVRTPTGQVSRYRNHDPERLTAIVDSIGAGVTINSAYAILRVGAFCFSVRKDTGRPLDPCPTDHLVGDISDEQLAARIQTHGGVIGFRPKR